MSELPIDAFPLLTRKQAVGFIRSELGIPISYSTIDKKCMRGEGPPVARFYGRRELYTQQALREWALNLSTTEPAQLGAA